MRLTDPKFAASFVRCEETLGCRDPDCFIASPRPHDHRSYVRVAALDDAQGVELHCPCGVGSLIVLFSNPRRLPVAGEKFGMRLRGNHAAPPPRWQMVSGTGLHDLTLAPSISVGDPECWHGWIQNGEVR